MKNYIFIFIAATFILFGCQKEKFSINEENIFEEKTQTTKLKNGEKSADLPEILFIETASEQNEVLVQMTLPQGTPPGDYTLEVTSLDKMSSFKVEFNNFNNSGIAKGIKPREGSGGGIVVINIYDSSSNADKPLFNYQAYVFEDGKTALQAPEVTGIHFVDDWQGETAYSSMEVSIANDPAQLAQDLIFTIDNEPLQLLPPRRRTKGGFVVDISGIEAFLPGARDGMNASIVLLSEKGIPVSNPQPFVIAGAKADFSGRIRRIRIRENQGDVTFRIAAVVEDVNEAEFDYAEVKFGEFGSNPKPNSTMFRIRKRPDLLLQEWDQLADESIELLRENPLFMAGNDDKINPLFFEKSAVGYTYPVTVQMFDSKGKEIGPLQKFEITVEAAVVNDEPVIQSTRIFSTDGGKTWTYQLIIEDKGKWVEKAQVEFDVNPEAPTPITNPVYLGLVGEKGGNIEIYEEAVKFDGDPTGFLYTARISQFGIGTRSTVSQCGSKPELL